MPRRATQSTTPKAPVPPGPHAFEVRVNGKIVFLQRVHTYQIDQGDEQVTISAVLKLPVEPTLETDDS
jgi:hypothetical protein